MCTLEKRGNVFILTLTGDADHRLSLSLISQLRSALSQIISSSSSSSSALVTTAAGNRFFCNGFDLLNAVSVADLAAMSSAFSLLVADLMSLPMPTVAAVTGHAAAAGLLLALSHDYVAMRGDRGVLYASELDVGVPLPGYCAEILKGKITDAAFLKRVVMRGEKVTAAEAAEKGVVDLVRGSAEETVAAAVEMAEGLARRGWDGRVYASVRRGIFRGVCSAVGMAEESDEDRRKLAASRFQT